jgi:hypothetical protein
VTGQVRRQPASRPPPGEQRAPAIPHISGRAQAVQEQQDGLPAAALLDPQASVHIPQSATTYARPAGPMQTLAQRPSSRAARWAQAAVLDHARQALPAELRRRQPLTGKPRRGIVSRFALVSADARFRGNAL